MLNNKVLTRDYRCARCWGAIVELFIGGKFVVVCAADHEHEGYVTSTFVERRKKMNALEAAEVGSFYAEMLGLERPANATTALYGDDDKL